MIDPPKGRFTIRSAGLFFFLSAIFQLLSMKSGVPFLDEMLCGGLAVFYHLIYFLIFAGMGFVLWTANGHGVTVIFAGTLVFSIEKILLLIHPQTLQLAIDQLTSFRPDLILMIGPDTLKEPIIFINLLFLLSWWGFAFYIFLRREYFDQ